MSYEIRVMVMLIFNTFIFFLYCPGIHSENPTCHVISQSGNFSRPTRLGLKGDMTAPSDKPLYFMACNNDNDKNPEIKIEMT